MTLTRAQIIAEALSQVGRTDLTSNARLWLNLFLDKIYKTQDWKWLEKDAGTLTLTDGGAVPTDYNKLKSANLIYNGSVQGTITTVEADEWMAYKRMGTSTGNPTKVYIDAKLRTFNFWPTPALSFTWNPVYYYLPTLPDHTDSATDSQTPVWGEHWDFLIKALELKGMFFNDDERYKQAESDLIAELLAAKMNSYDTRAGSNRLKFGKSFRRRF